MLIYKSIQFKFCYSDNHLIHFKLIENEDPIYKSCPHQYWNSYLYNHSLNGETREMNVECGERKMNATYGKQCNKIRYFNSYSSHVPRCCCRPWPFLEE